MKQFNESTIEEAALSWLAGLGYATLSGPEIAPGEDGSEREAFSDVVLEGRLGDAIHRLNPDLPGEAKDDALRKALLPDLPSPAGSNRKFHLMLRDRIELEYRREDGSVAGDNARLVDFDNPDNKDFLAVNQFTVIEEQHKRRPDIVVFVNGLPLDVIELKSAGG